MLGNLFSKSPSLKGQADLIDKIIRSLGLKPEEQRVASDDPNKFCWVLQRGSATILLHVTGDPKTGEGWFQISCPLVFLPEQNLMPFYRKLLDINGELMGASLGTRDDCVSLCAERPLKGMDFQEAEEILHRVAGYADHLDDMLHNEFAAPMWRPDR